MIYYTYVTTSNDPDEIHDMMKGGTNYAFVRETLCKTRDDAIQAACCELNKEWREVYDPQTAEEMQQVENDDLLPEAFKDEDEANHEGLMCSVRIVTVRTP